MEKIVCKKMTMFALTHMLKNFAEDNFSSPLQKNNGPSLICTLGPTRSSGRGGIGVLGDSTDSDLSGGSVLLPGY